jgi:hypothetical protein
MLLLLRAGWCRLRRWRATRNPAANAAPLAGGVPS